MDFGFVRPAHLCAGPEDKASLIDCTVHESRNRRDRRRH
jgi:hypothetical protein